MDILLILTLSLLILLIFTILALLYASGLFASFSVSITSDIPYLNTVSSLYYKINQGPYTSLGSLFTEAYTLAPNITQCGIYYDNADDSDPENTRAAVGVLIADNSEYKSETLEESGFKKFVVPKTSKAVYARFPHTSILSIIIGMRRLHPKLKSVAKEMECSNPTIIEIYDADSIHYIALVEDLDAYLVEDFRSSKQCTAGPVSSQELGLDKKTQ